MTPEEIKIRQRLKDDFPHFASKCLKIVNKDMKTVPLVLNNAQLLLHSRLQEQLKRKGYTRMLVPKGRQTGVSTYTQARFIWRLIHSPATKAYILTHLADATANLFEMTKRYYDNLPKIIQPHTSKCSQRELFFDRLDSGYKCGTAGSKGVGRSSTIHLFHGSETAYFENEEEIIAGILQAVPNSPGTEMILESTSAGPQGMFYEYCMKAQRGEGEFELCFLPWFLQQEYRTQLPQDFHLNDEEEEYKSIYNLDDEQLYWRRLKIESFLTGIEKFRREYPATLEECFMAEIADALWKRHYFIHSSTPPPNITRTIVAIDPATTNKKKSDKTGIIVASLTEDKKVYIHRNRTGKYDAGEWPKIAVRLYHEYNASRIVAETNQGGDLIEHIIKKIDNTIPYTGEHVRKDPYARAEPVANQYKIGNVIHGPGMLHLEDSMVSWNPNEKEHLPDDVSATMIAIANLLDLTRKQKSYYVL